MFEPVQRRRGLSLNLHATWARAYVRLTGLNREPSWMLHETVLPFIGACAYVYIYRALGAPPRFEGFALLGMAMATYWFAVLWGMAAQFYWEKEMGNLELYLQAPINRMSILAGMAIGSMVTSTIRFLTIILAGSLFFGIRYDVTSWPAFVAVFALTLTALYGLGIWVAPDRHQALVRGALALTVVGIALLVGVVVGGTAVAATLEDAVERRAVVDLWRAYAGELAR